MIKTFKKEIEIAGKKLTLESGEVAMHANASVLARWGDTVVLATVCNTKAAEETSYFPLTVDYEERLYAGGRISTSRFIKREGRPSEAATLTARMIDRSIRPLFPQNLRDEVQVIITVLSVDQENDPDILSLLAVSTALAISSIPWSGPAGAVRIGYHNNSFLINPTNIEKESSQLDLIVASVKGLPVMIEANAANVTEELMARAIKLAQAENDKIIGFIENIKKEFGKEKGGVLEEEALAGDKRKEIIKFISEQLLPSLDDPKAAADETWFDKAIEQLEVKFTEKLEVGKKQLTQILESEVKNYVRQQILEKGKRADNRKTTDVRQLQINVGLLPRTHGSALFQRGETQVLSIVTLGSPALEQLIEGMKGEATKRYMHHYNFPPFSTGEVRRVGPSGRREIGHGALAERALLPVIPDEEKFPYTIRVVSEVLSSSGSTSMASVCGSTLALMDAGVPISEPVAGVAIGLITGKDKYVLLTDIAYAEDTNGDMDFKAAGTKSGITAIQMDIKIPGVAIETLEQALQQAKEARLFILDEILAVLPAPRPQISSYAPKIRAIHIDPSKIGDVIGSGGRTINNIIAKTNTAIDIDDDGKVTVAASSEEDCQKAVEIIENLTREVKAGEVFEGQVKRILPFGAMVEILPGKEGLVHISQLAPYRVNRIEDVVEIGQTVKVRVTELDEQGRVNLSMIFGQQAAVQPPPYQKQARRHDHRRQFNRQRRY